MLHIVERQRNNASSEKAFYEALCVLHASGVSSTQKYEAQLTLHEAALRAMKRSLFRLHVFLPESGQKNGRPFLLNSEFSLKLKWLQVNKSWLSLCYLAKISLFSAFLKTEKNFQLN